MTDEEYMTESRNAHQRLAILREQIGPILDRAHPDVSIGSLQTLLARVEEICGEIADLERRRWGNA